MHLQTEQARQAYTPSTGDRILTPSDRLGVIQPPPWIFPGYSLIEFSDEGVTHWIRDELLRPVPPDFKVKKQRSKKK